MRVWRRFMQCDRLGARGTGELEAVRYYLVETF